MVHILVIAFAVNGSIAFEGRSELIRQALRQEELINSIKKELRIDESVNHDFIFPASGKEQEPAEKYESIFQRSLKWMKENRDKRVKGIFYVSEDTFGDNKLILVDDSFNPIAAVIFFSAEEKK